MEVRQFMDVTGADEETAKNFLDGASGDAGEAVCNYFKSRGSVEERLPELEAPPCFSAAGESLPAGDKADVSCVLPGPPAGLHPPAGTVRGFANLNNDYSESDEEEQNEHCAGGKNVGQKDSGLPEWRPLELKVRDAPASGHHTPEVLGSGCSWQQCGTMHAPIGLNANAGNLRPRQPAQSPPARRGVSPVAGMAPGSASPVTPCRTNPPGPTGFVDFAEGVVTPSPASTDYLSAQEVFSPEAGVPLVHPSPPTPSSQGPVPNHLFPQELHSPSSDGKNQMISEDVEEKDMSKLMKMFALPWDTVYAAYLQADCNVDEAVTILNKYEKAADATNTDPVLAELMAMFCGEDGPVTPEDCANALADCGNNHALAVNKLMVLNQQVPSDLAALTVSTHTFGFEDRQVPSTACDGDLALALQAQDEEHRMAYAPRSWAGTPSQTPTSRGWGSDRLAQGTSTSSVTPRRSGSGKDAAIPTSTHSSSRRPSSSGSGVGQKTSPGGGGNVARQLFPDVDMQRGASLQERGGISSTAKQSCENPDPAATGASRYAPRAGPQRRPKKEGWHVALLEKWDGKAKEAERKMIAARKKADSLRTDASAATQGTLQHRKLSTEYQAAKENFTRAKEEWEDLCTKVKCIDNASYPEPFDLHNQTLEQAMRRVKKVIAFNRDGAEYAGTTFVTGQGKHSVGGFGVIRDKVHNYLREEKIPFTEAAHGGALSISIEAFL